MQFVPVGWIHNGAFLPVIWFMNKKVVKGRLLAHKKLKSVITRIY